MTDSLVDLNWIVRGPDSSYGPLTREEAEEIADRLGDDYCAEEI
ncbi:hypothetical protein [Mycolicibacterium porcinum]|nr:hypothetical protein [Mycolicibacterium porcinum]